MKICTVEKYEALRQLRDSQLDSPTDSSWWSIAHDMAIDIIENLDVYCVGDEICAKWKDKTVKFGKYSVHKYECSRCGFEVSKDLSNGSTKGYRFCGECGSKMEV